MPEFTNAELQMIVQAFMRGSDDRFMGFNGRTAEGGVSMTIYCVWCRHATTGVTGHSPTCEGQARMRIAAKARQALDARLLRKD